MRRAGLEELRERALSHLGADLGGVAGLVKEVGLNVERDRHAGVAEDAADLGGVEAEVED
jgi:hypothetical protein